MFFYGNWYCHNNEVKLLPMPLTAGPLPAKWCVWFRLNRKDISNGSFCITIVNGSKLSFRDHEEENQQNFYDVKA